MLVNAYSVYDLKAKVFHVPFYAPTDVLAMRNLQAAVQEPGSLLSKFPSDFRCFRIGLFNDESGEFVPCTPEFLCALDNIGG